MTNKKRPAVTGALGTASACWGRYEDYTTGAITKTPRPQVGEIVSVPGIGRCHVVGDSDPSLLTVQNAQGTTFKVGEKSVERLDGGTR